MVAIRRLPLYFAKVTLALLLPSTSYPLPKQITEMPKIVAVEPRLYNPRYDVTAQFSILPIDAFYKGYALGVSYTQSMSSDWSWEIANLNFNSKSDTGLVQKLISLNVAPKGFLDPISWYLTSSAIYRLSFKKYSFQRVYYAW